MLYMFTPHPDTHYFVGDKKKSFLTLYLTEIMNEKKKTLYKYHYEKTGLSTR